MRICISLFLGWELVLSCCGCGVTQARAREGLSVEDAASAVSFGTPKNPVDLSPDGKRVAYVLQDPRKQRRPSEGEDRSFSSTGVPFDFIGCDVWIADVKTGRSRNLTRGRGTSWGPSWSPDGRRLAFYSDRDGAARLWVWDRVTDKLWVAAKATVRPFLNYYLPRWTPDGNRVLTKVLPEGTAVAGVAAFFAKHKKIPDGMSTESAISLMGAPAERPPGSAGVEPKVVVLASGDSGATDGSSKIARVIRIFSQLALIDIRTGDVKHLSDTHFALGYWMSPSGRHVAFTRGTEFASGKSQQILFDIAVVDLQTRVVRVVAHNARQFYTGYNVSWSPDGRRLAYFEWGPQTNGDCFVVSLDGGLPRKLTVSGQPGLGGPFRSPVWDRDAESVYGFADNAVWRMSLDGREPREVLRVGGWRILRLILAGDSTSPASDDGKHVYMLAVDDEANRTAILRGNLESGESIPVHIDSRNYGDTFTTDTSSNGTTTVYVAEDADQSPDLWIAEAWFSRYRRLTSINPRFDRYAMGKSRLLEWEDGGKPRRAALLLPSNYQEGRRYPLIVWTYGGGYWSNYVNRFGLCYISDATFNMQLLATRGFAVLAPDLPLGTGHPMQEIATGVSSAIDEVVNRGIADQERLGIMGNSYGGYSVLATIVQTKRFKAAIVRSGFADLVGFYTVLSAHGSAEGVGYIEEGQGGMGGSLWEYRDRYRENSPLYFFDRIETPVMIVHGTLDSLPVHLGDQIFVALRRLGKPSLYVRYEGERHGIADHANVVDYCNRMISWFERYLSDKKTGGDSGSPEGCRREP